MTCTIGNSFVPTLVLGYVLVSFFFSFCFFVYIITQIRKNGTEQAIKDIFGMHWGTKDCDINGLDIFVEIIGFGIFWPIISVNFAINKLFVGISSKN